MGQQCPFHAAGPHTAMVPPEPTGSDPGVVEVIVEGEVFKGHPMILAASPVFAHMMTATFREKGARRIELEGKSKEEFRAVLRFLKPTTLNAQQIDANNVDYLARWFHDLELAGLKDECEEFLLGLPCTLAR